MTVTSSKQDVSYDTDGITTSFPITFYFLDESDIVVDKIDANDGVQTLVLGTDYQVTGAGSQTGGTLSTLSSILPGFKLHIYRQVDVTQETKFQQNDAFPSSAVEKAFDKLTMIAQQEKAASDNAIRFPPSEFGSDGILPIAAQRAKNLVAFDELGNVAMVPLPASVGAGDLRNESWTAGTDFVAGTDNTVQLSRAYATKANLGTVVMAGVPQDPASYSLSGAGTQLVFDAVIPEGVNRIWCVGGTTLSIYVPPDGSVNVEKLAASQSDRSAMRSAIFTGDPYQGFGASEAHGSLGKEYSFTKGVPGVSPDTDDSPLRRSQWFFGLNREATLPWCAQEVIQTVIQEGASEKVCSQLIEMFSYVPNKTEHIAQVIMVHAEGTRAPSDGDFGDTGSGGDLWGSWIRVSNDDFLAHGIAQELNCRNTFKSDLRTRAQLDALGLTSTVSFEDWADTPNAVGGGYPTHLMYVQQIFPDYSCRHLTRGISIQPTRDAGAINPNTGAAEQIAHWVGYHTGINLTGYVDTGIYLDSQIDVRNVGFSWEPNANTIAADPVAIVFGYHTKRKMLFERLTGSGIQGDWLLSLENNFLVWRRDGANVWQAFDADTNNLNFANALISFHMDGRAVIGGTSGPVNSPGLSLVGANNIYPFTMQALTAFPGGGPGAGHMALRVENSGTPGKLRLVAYGNTSNTATVIADNIG